MADLSKQFQYDEVEVYVKKGTLTFSASPAKGDVSGSGKLIHTDNTNLVKGVTAVPTFTERAGSVNTRRYAGTESTPLVTTGAAEFSDSTLTFDYIPSEAPHKAIYGLKQGDDIAVAKVASDGTNSLAITVAAKVTGLDDGGPTESEPGSITLTFRPSEKHAIDIT